MRIVLNGEPRDAADNIPLSELLASLQLDSSRVAVEVNVVWSPLSVSADIATEVCPASYCSFAFSAVGIRYS